MESDIRLSQYADELVKIYYDNYSNNCYKVIKFLKEKIDKDLHEFAKTDNAVSVFNNLIGWLFKFYSQELNEAFKQVGFDYDSLNKYMIFCFIITFFRDDKRAHILYDSLKEKNIVTKFLSYDDKKYELYTSDYGIITFYSIDSYFSNNSTVKNKIEKMGRSIIDGCHEISEFLIKQDDSLYALSGILDNILGQRIFHSVVLDKDLIIDIPNGVIMSYDDYNILNNYEIITKHNYKELLSADKKCKIYDESNTLYPLLRCMLYKMWISERDNS